MVHRSSQPAARRAAWRPLLTVAAAVAAMAGPGTGAQPCVAATWSPGADPGTFTAELRFSGDDLTIRDSDGYHYLQLAGASTPLTGERGGAPALPVVPVHFVLPPDAVIAGARVTASAPQTIAGTFLPVPVRPLAAPGGQDPGTGDDEPEPDPDPDPVIYNGAAPYPGRFEIGFRTGWMRGHAIGTVLVSPLEYVGAGGALRLYRRLTVELTVAPGAAAGADQVRRRSPARSPHSLEGRELTWLRRLVVNPDDIARFDGGTAAAHGGPPAPRPFAGFLPTEVPSTDGPPVEYVIVTDNVTLDGRALGDLVAEFQRLADWKTAKGTPAVVRTVSWIRAHYDGHDDAARIRAFLIDAYELWGTDYVLLGGDGRIVPFRRFNGINLGSGDPPADVYYGGLDGDWNLDNDVAYGEWATDVEASDPYWDVWVGRAPVENQTEAQVLVDKSLSYARVPGTDTTGLDPSYYERMLLLCGMANCPTWGLSCNGLYVGESIKRRLAPPQFEVTRMYQQLLDPSPSCSYHETYVELADSTQVPWTRAAALDALEAGVGFVHHFEHSNPYEEGGASGGFGCAVTSGGSVGREYVDLLTNGPNWPIVYSTGAGVNAFDYESVSEHWVLNPQGGAVAYLGKTRSGSVTAVTGVVDTLFFQTIFQDAATVGQASAFATQTVAASAERAVSTFGLLGDPELQPWTAAPASMTIAIDPPIFTPGDQLIEVTLQDAVTQTPVAGARAALVQGDRAYAYGLTDAAGAVRFAVTLPVRDDVALTATAPGYLPAVATLPASLVGTALVSYLEHAALDDSTGAANQNGIVDAGEIVKLDVTVENTGLAAATGTTGELTTIGAVELAVTVDGDCRPDLVFIGVHDQQPPAGVCTLRFPELEYRGGQPLGRPTAYTQTQSPGLFLWREDDAWHLIARGEAGPAPPDRRFEGVIYTPGDHSGVAAGALEPGDVWTAGAPDSITFDFTTSGDGDQDSLIFHAREIRWLAVTDSAGAFGDLAPAATAADRFVVEIKSSIPDRHEPRLELVARDGGGGEIGRSSFSVPVAAPDLDYAHQSVDYSPPFTGNDTAGTIAPVIRNRGSGTADQVSAVLRLHAGTGTVTDSLVVIGALPAGGEATPAALFGFTTPDTQSVRFSVEIRNQYPDGSVRAWQRSPIDVMAPCPPTDLIIETTQARSARLKWTQPAASCAPDLAGYNVYRQLLGQGGFERAGSAPFDSTQTFMDVLLQPDTTWVYTIAARDSSGNESARLGPAEVTTWVREHPGWPLAVDAGTPSSPLVIDIEPDGAREIFLLGNALYGWHADGTPVIAGNDDGVVFRPPRPASIMGLGGMGAFGSSPAAADLDGDGTIELAISAWDDSLWVVRATGELLWGRHCVPKLSSPVLGDLDGDNDLEIIVGSDRDTVYAWHHDGTPVVAANPSGALAALPDGARVNYTTPALGDIDGNEATEEVIYSTFRGAVYAWDGSGTLLWSALPGAARPLSTPALGDVDQDGTPEVVVAQSLASAGSNANALHILDAETGAVERTWAGNTQIPGDLFTSSNFISAPSLADLDGDGDLEIVVGTSGFGPGKATVLVFHHDDPGGFALSCVDQIPNPGHNNTGFSGQAITSQAIIADLDGGGDLEVAAGSATFGLFMFGVDGGMQSCDARAGWPLLLSGEIHATPFVGDLDGDGLFDMVAGSFDGEVHRFDLGTTFGPGLVQWGQYAHDARHTSNYGAATAGEADPAGAPRHRLSLAQNAPNPFRSPTRIAYSLATRARVRMRVYSVDGRLVRTLVDRIEPPGQHAVTWDGRGAGGADVPAGIYFYRLEAGGRALTRKLLRIK